VVESVGLDLTACGVLTPPRQHSTAVQWGGPGRGDGAASGDGGGDAVAVVVSYHCTWYRLVLVY